MNKVTCHAVLGLIVCLSASLFGQNKPSSRSDEPSAKAVRDESRDKRFQRLSDQLTNVKFVGQFTIVGRDEEKLSKDEYTIHKVEKLPEGEKWLFHCRIKYGEHDLAVPLPIDVEWAGETPVITLDNLTIPGLGTFSSRVVIHDNMYAGTWRHDKVGGHLFGTIEKIDEKNESRPSRRQPDSKKN